MNDAGIIDIYIVSSREERSVCRAFRRARSYNMFVNLFVRHAYTNISKRKKAEREREKEREGLRENLINEAVKNSTWKVRACIYYTIDIAVRYVASGCTVRNFNKPIE